MDKGLRLALVCALACVGVGGQGAQARANPVTASQSTSPAERTVFEKQGVDQLSPAFTKPTVLKLNAIVARSKAVIDSYDAMIAGTRAAVAHKPDPSGTGRSAVASLTALSAKANAALADMKVAEAHLKASHERYNDSILQGMVDFVTTVATEIATSRRQLSGELARR